MIKVKDPLTAEMCRLYHGESLTLREIGNRFGMIKQAVKARFVKAGIPRRPLIHQTIDKQTLEDLYSQNNLSLAKIAERLKTNYGVIEAALKYHKIDKRPPITPGGKFTQRLRTLAVNETTDILIGTKAPQAQLHRAAAVADIKISVRRIKTGLFKVRRLK